MVATDLDELLLTYINVTQSTVHGPCTRHARREASRQTSHKVEEWVHKVASGKSTRKAFGTHRIVDSTAHRTAYRDVLTLWTVQTSLVTAGLLDLVEEAVEGVLITKEAAGTCSHHTIYVSMRKALDSIRTGRDNRRSGTAVPGG
jgi:hypothetical protein